jgi:glutamyl/glutaminyl-tRNA synthetase
MCFCSPERLENLKNEQLSKGNDSQYDSKCRKLGSEEIEKSLREGKKFTIRFKVKKGDIEFNDLIRGKIKFSSEVIGDFIIIKSDGTPSYNFAVVVDDSDMMITHVLRGEDHITNTARQIMLFERIGIKIPYFAHSQIRQDR